MKGISSRWTIEDLKKKLAAGTIRGYVVKQAPKKSKKKGEPREIHKTVRYFIKIIEAMKIPYELEHQFSEERRFRFDLAIPSLMLGIEYEGIFSGKSRHTTMSGYIRDTEKYNLAQAEGWTVMRYTARTWKQFETDLLTISSKYNGTTNAQANPGDLEGAS